jgi:hypothetical protein
MKKIILLLTVALTSILSLTARADYFSADLKTSDENPNMGVHLIIAGKGLEVVDQWLIAAQSQALVFKDRKNHGPIKIISAIDLPSYSEYIKAWGYSNVRVFKQTMTDQRVVSLIAENQKIASIDFIGHNGAIKGLALENYDNRFFMDAVQLMAPLKSRFTADSFIRVMGCNTGWNLAPALANALNVPAAGTFTFADIQKLHETNVWYYNDKGRFPEGTKFNTVNSVSYSEPITCKKSGGCLRLKPVSIAYQGKHGKYSGTLPFMKFFCGNLSTNDCARRMAKSTQYLIGINNLQNKPSQNLYAETVSDHFCSAWLDSNKRVTCQRQIMDHMNGQKSVLTQFKTVSENMLTCDFKKCAFKTNCDSGTCVLEADVTKGASTATYDELNMYKLGYTLWMNEP